MGAEAKCHARANGRSATGLARLETDVLQFRGEGLRLSIPFKAMSKVVASDGELRVTSPDGTATLDLGTAAEKWADKIRNPPSRLQKIGVKPEWLVSVLGVEDAGFLQELRGAVSKISVGRVVKNCDAIFVGATKTAQLSRLKTLKSSLKANGALWVIRPKGRPEITESAVMAAGKAAGLVDVKVVGFSPTHTAEKFVIPISKRR
ncbi:MAG TPA: hypothetical protein VH497_00830 [Vicinamibacterales bacterium]|jgi:hypothetical protein